MAVTQRSGEPAPISLHAHLPSPAWPSPGVMQHRRGTEAWRGDGTSKTVWSPGPGPRQVTGGHSAPAGACPELLQPVLSGLRPGARASPSPAPHPLGQHVCPVGLLALGTLSLRGYETHAYEGHRPFAHKMGRLGCVTSGWVSSLTRVSCALSRARTQFRHFCLVKHHLWAQVLMLVGAGPRHPAYTYSIL